MCSYQVYVYKQDGQCQTMLQGMPDLEVWCMPDVEVWCMPDVEVW